LIGCHGNDGRERRKFELDDLNYLHVGKIGCLEDFSNELKELSLMRGREREGRGKGGKEGEEGD